MAYKVQRLQIFTHIPKGIFFKNSVKTFFLFLTNGSDFFSAMGTCLPVYGKKQGERCSRDTDCDSGFLCIDSGYGRSCQTPVPGDKGLGNFFQKKKKNEKKEEKKKKK